MTLAGDSNVKVALRIRPQNANEQMDMCRECIFPTQNESQVVLGKDRLFTFDYVFNNSHSQDGVFRSCFHPLILSAFDGYNVTILAYGQTGSGKTYTMGTGFDDTIDEEELGCVPRAISLMFDEGEKAKKTARLNGTPEPQFEFSVSFIELYNDEIHDLLAAAKLEKSSSVDEDSTGDVSSARSTPVNTKSRSKGISIREDNSGEIVISGVHKEQVSSQEGLLECLQKGTLSRTTASTNMNTHSSRSHAVYTIYLTYKKPFVKIKGSDISVQPESAEELEWQVFTSKMHFVDLAGSERLKRTKASGIRAKEGIAINSGLLALGNVISALGDINSKATHIPYRDSKLTRLLQDSLGGNSRTLMIACVSPADRDFMETHNTLKYANRARNIRNAAVVNQDTQSMEIASLRAKIAELQLQIETSRPEGIASVCEEDVAKENRLLLSENVELKKLLDQKEEMIAKLTDEVIHFRAQKQMFENDNEDYKVIESNLKRISQLEECLSATQLQLDHEIVKGNSNYNIPNLLCDPEGYSDEEDGRDPNCFVLPGNRGDSLVAMDLMNRWKASGEKVSTVFVLTAMSESVYLSSCNCQPHVKRILQLVREEDNELNHENYFNTSRRRIAGLLKSLHEKELDSKKDDTCDALSTPSVKRVSGSLHSLCKSNGNVSSISSVIPNLEPVSPPAVEVVNGKLVDEKNHFYDDGDAAKGIENVQESAKSKNSGLQEELDSLTDSIVEKEKLVSQLEKSKKKIEVIKEEFSNKIERLEKTIKTTQLEKDKALREAEKTEKTKVEEKKKIVDSYEAKLKTLKKQLEKTKYQQQEHLKLEKVKKKSDRTIAALQEELLSMKRQKVKLQNKIKEESVRVRDIEQNRKREINKLKQESQTYQNQLKKLEMQNKKQEVVLKRKLEEVVAIQRKLRNNESGKKNLTTEGDGNPEDASIDAIASHSSKVSSSRRRSSSFLIKHKKECLEKEASRIILHRQALFQMGRLMKDREIAVFSKESQLEKVQSIVNERFMECNCESERKDCLDEIKEAEELIESLDAQIDYLNERISQVQEDVIYTESNGESMTKAISLIRSCSSADVKYLLEHFFRLVVDIKCAETKRVSHVHDLEEQLKKTKDLLVEKSGNENPDKNELPCIGLELNNDFKTNPIVIQNPGCSASLNNFDPKRSDEGLKPVKRKLPVIPKSSSPYSSQSVSVSNLSGSSERVDSPKSEDVFSRLASSTDLSESIDGRVVSTEKRIAPFVKSTHTIFGHSGAVLALTLNDENVFSASQGKATCFEVLC